jgi:hypothetical protein
MHSHYINCKGVNNQNQQFPIGQFPLPQYQAPQPQLYIPPPTPVHRHQWFENDTYKVCLDQSCKEIKPKLKGSWMIFTRYALKIFVIELIIAFAIAFSAASALGVHR